MSNDEIEALMANSGENSEETSKAEASSTSESSDSSDNSFDMELPTGFISQEDMDSLLTGFVAEDSEGNENLIDEIHGAILDSGKLSLMQWVKLRERLREIEEIIPTIDIIIKLKSKNETKLTDEQRR